MSFFSGLYSSSIAWTSFWSISPLKPPSAVMIIKSSLSRMTLDLSLSSRPKLNRLSTRSCVYICHSWSKNFVDSSTWFFVCAMRMLAMPSKTLVSSTNVAILASSLAISFGRLMRAPPLVEVCFRPVLRPEHLQSLLDSRHLAEPFPHL